MKRSSCDSGSGNVPAKSCGFCVAMTKNGSGSGMVCPSIETCASFIAFEERGLRARACAVDLVREQHVREDRSLTEDELGGALIVDGDADDVARQQIGCKLHASQLAADGARERARERRLADAGHVFDEQVPAGEERDERELDGVGLAFESPLHSLPQLLDERKLLS